MLTAMLGILSYCVFLITLVKENLPHLMEEKVEPLVFIWNQGLGLTSILLRLCI